MSLHSVHLWVHRYRRLLCVVACLAKGLDYRQNELLAYFLATAGPLQRNHGEMVFLLTVPWAWSETLYRYGMRR